MFLYVAIYFTLTGAVLAGLCLMIQKIGAALTDCPVTGRAAQAGSLTIITGFAAIGAGAISLIGAAVLEALPHASFSTLLGAVGLSSLCLGLGFTHAVATLRDVVSQASKQANGEDPEPAPKPTPWPEATA